MIYSVNGTVDLIEPNLAVIDCGGVGYACRTTANTLSQLKIGEKAKLLTYLSVREDAVELFGFYDAAELNCFRMLISVSGVGPNTARMILSSLSAPELEQVIVSENVNILKSVKGIGAKTAQRIIVDLKDKIKPGDNTLNISMPQNQEVQDEAVAALVMLGFPQTASMKVVQKLLNESPTLKVEAIIKAALKML